MEVLAVELYIIYGNKRREKELSISQKNIRFASVGPAAVGIKLAKYGKEQRSVGSIVRGYR
jgi:hypothetical protein